MSLDRVYPKWQGAEDLQLMRSEGMRPVTVFRDGMMIAGPVSAEFWTPYLPWRGSDFTDIEFTLDAFEAVDDGYALDVTCPCGAPLWADNAGDLLREIYNHCGAAGHPLPKFER